MKWLLANSITPKVIFNGSKILSLDVVGQYRIKFRDSLNFMPMSLAAWASAFGMEEQKTYFPHEINSADYWGKTVPFPKRTSYSYNVMSKGERKKFLKFYRKERRLRKNKFDVNATLAEYCQTDVRTLRACCQEFRKLFMELSQGICPFSAAITLPGGLLLVLPELHLSIRTYLVY